MARELDPRMHFRSLEAFRREIDDIFSRSLGANVRSSTLDRVFPPIEAFLDGNEYVLRLDLPGIDPQEIEVTVREEVATIRGSRKPHARHAQWDLINCEIIHGDFERSIAIPRGVRVEDIKAAYNHGVLELRMPAPKETLRRKVPIQVENTKGKNS
ncbi:MAG: Hsp20/alpha crystallin family protein [Candidatus Binataceae bacterium]